MGAKNIRPVKSGTGNPETAYILKHALQEDTDVYMTVDGFTDLMEECGYRAKRSGAFRCQLSAELRKRIKEGKVMA